MLNLTLVSRSRNVDFLGYLGNLGISWVSTRHKSSATLDGMTKLFNPAIPIEVKCNEISLRPTKIVWLKVTCKIERIILEWEIDTDWWETTGRVWRRYMTVTTREGLLITLYKDMLTDEYFVQKLYD